jgi:hypothetical protein
MKKIALSLFALVYASSAHAVLSVYAYQVPEICGYANGSVYATGVGGQPPYAYLWNTGDVTQTVTGLIAGTYSVTVTDDLGSTASADINVLASNSLYGAFGTQQPDCHFQCTAIVGYDKTFAGGVEPYTYSVQPFYEENAYALFSTCAGVITPITITDANGCSLTTTFQTFNADPAEVQILQVQPACNGVNGSLTAQALSYGPEAHELLVYDTNYALVTGLPINNGPPWQTFVVSDLPAGNYHLRTNLVDYPGGCFNEVPFTITDLGTNCNSVMGHVFLDQQQDCLFQPLDETPIAYRVLEVQPGPYYGLTAADGSYRINLPNGDYTVSTVDPDLIQLCPVDVPAPFTIDDQAPIAIVDLADSSIHALDLELDCNASQPRIGNVQHLWITVRDLSPYYSASFNLNVTFDPALTFINSNYAPSSQSPGTLTWNSGYLSGYGTRTYSLLLQIPNDPGLIGTTLSTAASVSTLGEINVSNNTCTHSEMVLGAFDPNDKRARTSSGQSDALYVLQEDTSITYTIRFQNTGNAAAMDVLVIDTLPPTLDVSTFRYIAASHNCVPSIEEQGVVKFNFPFIDLPDSGSNEVGSHGFVSFRIRPLEGVVLGTEIRNEVGIYFDQNPPVITEPSILTVENSTGISTSTASGQIQLWPNPVKDVLHLDGLGGNVPRTITLMSADGRVLRRVDAPIGNAVQVTELSTGIYFLRLVTADGECVLSFIK